MYIVECDDRSVATACDSHQSAFLIGPPMAGHHGAGGQDGGNELLQGLTSPSGNSRAPGVSPGQSPGPLDFGGFPFLPRTSCPPKARVTGVIARQTQILPPPRMRSERSGGEVWRRVSRSFPPVQIPFPLAKIPKGLLIPFSGMSAASRFRGASFSRALLERGKLSSVVVGIVHI